MADGFKIFKIYRCKWKKYSVCLQISTQYSDPACKLFF